MEAGSGSVSVGVVLSWREVQHVLHPAAQSDLLLLWERLWSWGVDFSHFLLPFPADNVKR